MPFRRFDGIVDRCCNLFSGLDTIFNRFDTMYSGVDGTFIRPGTFLKECDSAINRFEGVCDNFGGLKILSNLLKVQ